MATSPARKRPPADKSKKANPFAAGAKSKKATPTAKKTAPAQKGVQAKRKAATPAPNPFGRAPAGRPFPDVPQFGMGGGHMANARQPLGRGGVGAGQTSPPSGVPGGMESFPGAMPQRRPPMPGQQMGAPQGQPNQIGQGMAQFRRPQQGRGQSANPAQAQGQQPPARPPQGTFSQMPRR